MSWTQPYEGLYLNEATGRYVLDGRRSFWCCPFGCATCEGRGRIDFRTIGKVLDVLVVNPGPGTTFGTAKALSDSCKNPRELVVFWKAGEIVELAKIRSLV